MTESGLKKPWDEVRKAAGVPWFRIHDMRHTAITRMAEAGVPMPVIMSFSGHLTARMMAHYTQISEQAKRAAVAAVRQGSIYQAPRFQPSPDSVEIFRKSASLCKQG
jgi:integrase